MMHFQSRFQYSILVPAAWIDFIRRAQFIHAAGTSILESGLKVHHYSCVQMRMRIKISTFPRQQKDPLLCLIQKPCYYPSIIRN